jgi:IclR family acetate operon transcriptional repressor
MTGSPTYIESRATDSVPEPSLLKTLQRGLLVLEQIAEQDAQATAKLLSEQTGLRIGTCYHLLRTLQHEGYVVRLPGGRYALGPRVAFLHDRWQAQFVAMPELKAILRVLRDRVNETSYIAGWQGNAIVLQDSLDGTNPVGVRYLRHGYRENPHARASCRSILSLLSEQRANAFLASYGELSSLTERTITDPEALKENLREAARLGYALDYEEFAEGVCCCSAAFVDAGGFPIGSLTISAPTGRFEDKRDELISAVVDAGIQASRLFGYEGTYPPRTELAESTN